MLISKTRRCGNGFLLLALSGIMISAPVQADTPTSLDDVSAVVEAAPAEAAPIPAIPEVAAPAVPVTLPAAPKAPFEHVGDGEASYYGNELAGNRTASGERFNPRALTAAHRSLPLGTKVRVTNQSNGKSVIVRINDRGPFVKSRLIDVSYAAAQQISMIRSGHARVKLELIA